MAFKDRIVRAATKADLPMIHNIIRDSFLAMEEFSCLGKQFWLNGADKLIKTELHEDNFETIYFDKTNDNHFWVIENTANGNIIGCVGLKRLRNEDKAELVRMGVVPEHRGHGSGSLLIKTLINYCKEKQNISQIHLTTGNPLSVKFYIKNGFVNQNYYLFHKCFYKIQ